MTSLSSSPPPSVDHQSSTAGLRAVATFEAVKGVLAVCLGIGLLSLLHRDVEHAAEVLLGHLHLSPDRRVSHVFLDAASRVTDARLWAISAGAVAYAAVRFVEAYGLWHRLVWAQWFALLSGAIYLPPEVLHLIDHRDAVHFSVVAINLLIVLYMLWVRVRTKSNVNP
jgi:uncharacterized membrane protein (DUF2068 family)